MPDVKELVAKIKLDAKDFTAALAEPKTAILAFAGSVAAVGTAAMLAAEGAAKHVTELYAMSKAAGENIETFSALAYAAHKSGLETEGLVKMMDKLAGSKAQDAMLRLGIAVTDNSGRFKTSTQMMMDLADKTAAAATPMERMQIVTSVFGEKIGGQFVAMMSKGSGGIKNLMKEAIALGQVFTKDDAEASRTFLGNQKKISTAMSGLTDQVGVSIVKWINHTHVMDNASAGIKAAIAWWMGLSQAAKDTIISITLVTSGMAALTIAGMALVPVIEAVGMAMNAAFVTNPVGALLAVITLAVAAGIALAAAFENVTSSGGKVALMAAAVLVPVVGLVAGVVLLVKHWDEVKAHAMAFYGAVQPMANALWKAFTELESTFNPMVVAFNAIKTLVMDSGVGAFLSGLFSGKGFEIPDVTRMVIANLINPVNTFAERVKEIFGTVLPFAVDLYFDRAVIKAKDAYATVSALVKDMFDPKGVGFQAVMQRLTESGQNFFSGFATAGADVIEGKFADAMIKANAKSAADNKARLDKYDADLVARRKKVIEASGGEDQNKGLLPDQKAITAFEKFLAGFHDKLKSAAENAQALREAMVGVGGPTAKVLDDMGNVSEAMSKASKGGADMGASLAYAFSKIGSVISSVGQTVGGFLQAQAAYAKVLFENLKTRMDFYFSGLQAMEEHRLADVVAGYDAELKALQDQKDAMVAAEAKYQADIQALKDEYAAKRKHELDQELKGEFDRLQQQYNDKVAAFQASGMAQVEVDQKTQEALDDLNAQKAQLISERDKRLAADSQANAASLDAQAKASADKRAKDEQALADKIKQIEADKAAAQDASAERTKNAEKNLKIFQWAAGKGAFEAGKHAQITSAEVGMATGLAQAAQAAAAMTAATFGLGLPLALAMMAMLSALITETSMTAIRTASAAQYPPPPVFDDGGFSGGPASGPGWRSIKPELHIPMDNPGKDFGALKDSVASALVSGAPRSGTINYSPIFNFSEREDYATIKERINQDLLTMIRSAVAGTA